MGDYQGDSGHQNAYLCGYQCEERTIAKQLARVLALLHHLVLSPFLLALPAGRYAPEALAAMPDPAANIFIEKGITTGGELLARLQRLRALLERQRRLACAAGAKAGAKSATGAAASSGDGDSAPARPVRLLVVDSVAHVFRDMGDAVGAAELTGRTELLFKLSALLR